MAKRKKRTRTKTTSAQSLRLNRFKAILNKKFGEINWLKVSTVLLATLIVLGAKGVFGPKAQLVSVLLIKGVVLS